MTRLLSLLLLVGLVGCSTGRMNTDAGVDLSSTDADQLADVLTYHVVEGDIAAAQLTDGMTLVSLEGQDLTIQRLQAGDPMAKVQDADIIYADIEASNGRIHLINLVLDPTRDGTGQ